MHQFYFNECLPQNTISFNEFVTLLSNTIREFDSLVKKNLEVDKGIFLEKETEKVMICERNLKEAIESIPDTKRELRNLAFAFFTKYPIQYFLKSEEIENEILAEEYKFEGIDATNLAIAKHHDCFLFSVAIGDRLQKDTLVINGSTNNLTLDNLYGEEKNTQFIESKIKNINALSKGNFELLKVELNNPIYTSAFEKAFKSIGSDMQEKIIDLFIRAKKRGLATAYFPDTNLIKDVTPDKNKKNAKVYELREKDDAVRVYFYEYNNVVFISSLGYKKDYKKDSGNAQSRAIQKALNDIDNLIKTG